MLKNVKMSTIVGILTFYEQNKFHALLRSALNSFITSRPGVCVCVCVCVSFLSEKKKLIYRPLSPPKVDKDLKHHGILVY